MVNHPPDDPIEAGLESLRERKIEADLADFEHRVWSEIALRDERGLRRFWSWLQAAQVRFPVPVAATFGIVAIGFQLIELLPIMPVDLFLYRRGTGHGRLGTDQGCCRAQRIARH